jgi:menaquinol-cytochrome c reductase cytochrome b subunit
MAKLKLPAPPIPDTLNPKPKRPGQGNGKVSPLDVGAEAGKTVVDWVDERTSLSGGARWMMFRKVPKGTNWFYTLGSSTMFAFLNQAVTGVFLAMYYVFLHMARTFFFGAYKYPRELNWVIGVALLVLTMAMSFTGYLLPFDQRSYWATIVGVNINATGPLVGPYLSDFLQAGPEFGATTLSRFYAIHMLLIPGAIAALIGAHLYLVAKLGTTAPPWVKPKTKAAAREEVSA